MALPLSVGPSITQISLSFEQQSVSAYMLEVLWPSAALLLHPLTYVPSHIPRQNCESRDYLSMWRIDTRHCGPRICLPSQSDLPGCLQPCLYPAPCLGGGVPYTWPHALFASLHRFSQTLSTCSVYMHTSEHYWVSAKVPWDSPQTAEACGKRHEVGLWEINLLHGKIFPKCQRQDNMQGSAVLGSI